MQYEKVPDAKATSRAEGKFMFMIKFISPEERLSRDAGNGYKFQD